MTRKPAILVDIDGTIADNSQRDPYDFESCGADLPIRPIIAVLDALWSGYEFGDLDVVFLTGRADRGHVRDITRAWLDRHTRYADAPLYMRPEGDFRPDEVVKRELYEQNVAPTHDVRFVLDDRTKVIRMWRSLGLTVLDVAGNEF